MKKIINLTALLLTACLIAPVVFADDPFGFDINVSPAKYDYCFSSNEWENVSYYCTNAPKPHPEFTDYLLWYIDDIGLCRLEANGRNIENDDYGLRTIEKIEQIKEQLKKKYGEPTLQTDFLRSVVSIYDGQPYRLEDAVERVRQEKLDDSYFWFPPEYKQVGNVVELSLTASAVNSSTGILSLAFEYPNLEACLQRRDDQASDAF